MFKRIFEDEAEGCGDVFDSCNQYEKASEDEKGSHNGYDFLCGRGQLLYAAEENDSADENQEETGYPGGNPEGALHGGTDGVRLYHGTHETEGQSCCYGKEGCQELSELSAVGFLNVVNRSAVDVAVFVNFTGIDGQYRLKELVGHTPIQVLAGALLGIFVGALLG